MKCRLIGLMIINLLMLSLVSSAWSYSFDGREWRQVTATTSISWNQLDVIYNVSTGDLDTLSSTIGGVEFDGWTWASNSDVAAMLSSFTNLDIGPYEVVDEFGSTWAPAILNIFAPTWVNSVAGITRETIEGEWSTSIGQTETFTQARSVSVFDYIPTQGGPQFYGPDTADTDGYTNLDTQSVYSGGWFHRDAAVVPEPATFILLGIGLVGLAGAEVRRRRKKKKVD